MVPSILASLAQCSPGEAIYLLQEEALKECTHSPCTTKLPSFIERLARKYAADAQERLVENDGFVSPGSRDEGFGHLFTILQPEWR
jgi:hypothetical protein